MTANSVSATSGVKPTLGIRAIANLSFGFLGIQVAFALQNANISRIFQSLGAAIDDLPILWLAGPVTGLLVQPIIGAMSDRTWNRWGRRRPFFMAGALLSALALIVLPNAGVLWLAVAAFWMLDVSVNVAMEPFRAFVGDMLPSSQRALGYAVQSIFIGAGALAASALPYVLSHYLLIESTAPLGEIPASVRLSFYLGAAALLLAILVTVLSTKEYSPEQLAQFENQAPKVHHGGFREALADFLADLVHLSPTMRRLAWVQFFTWSGFFVLWIYTTPVVAQHQFHAQGAGTALYNQAGDWVGILFAVYNSVAFLYGFLIGPLASRLGANRLHAINLILGAMGFAGLVIINDPLWLMLSMIGIGIAWGSVLTLPYTLLCEVVPYEKFGTYMGIFNLFIVLPQIMTSVVIGRIVHALWPSDPINIMWLAAGFFSLAAMAVWRRFA